MHPWCTFRPSGLATRVLMSQAILKEDNLMEHHPDNTRHHVYTGDECEACGAPWFFEPGYLTTLSNGSKVFTVERVVEHDDECPMLDIGDPED